MTAKTLEQQLQTFLEPADFPADPEPYLTDQRRRYRGEALVVRPDSVGKIQALLRFCRDKGIPLTPQGGNTGLCGGAVPARGGILLNLGRLNRIRSISPADNAITVEAGAILHTVQQAAAEAGRLFPLSLASEGSCQIGGNIATNAGGLNVLRYGTARDLVLGLEVVLPDGTLISHLAPLYKNTSGYELKHLFIGSEGTLGIITAATLRLFAPIRSRATAWVGVDSIARATELLTLLQNRFADRLSSFELIGRRALTLSAHYCGLQEPLDADWHILVEADDSLPDMPLDEQLAQLLFDNGFTDTLLSQSESDRNGFWRLREQISAAQRQLGVSIKHDIALPVSATAAMVEASCAELRRTFPEIDIVIFGHLGDGSLHYNTFFTDCTDEAAYRRENEINRIVYRHTLAHGGTVAAEHGIGMLKPHWLPTVRSPAEIALMRALKTALDPDGLFNPDKLLPPLPSADSVPSATAQ